MEGLNQRPSQQVDMRRVLGYEAQVVCCATCRYFRLHRTSAVTSDCLLMGQMLGIMPADEEHRLTTHARGMRCGYWSKRPKTWEIRSDGRDKCPYWVDPYIPRERQHRLRDALAAKWLKRFGPG